MATANTTSNVAESIQIPSRKPEGVPCAWDCSGCSSDICSQYSTAQPGNSEGGCRRMVRKKRGQSFIQGGRTKDWPQEAQRAATVTLPRLRRSDAHHGSGESLRFFWKKSPPWAGIASSFKKTT